MKKVLVTEGQVWEDRDSRRTRKTRVALVIEEKGVALCENVDTKRMSKIRLDRFTSNNHMMLVQSPPPTPPPTSDVVGS